MPPELHTECGAVGVTFGFCTNCASLWPRLDQLEENFKYFLIISSNDFIIKRFKRREEEKKG